MALALVKETESMPQQAKSRMIEGTAMLLARNGVQAASFSEIIKATGAPRGSIYHHFPQGKDQLIEAAIDLLAARAFAPLDASAGAPAEEIIAQFFSLWRGYLAGSQLQAGCAILAVTVTSNSPRLVAHTATIFKTWRTPLAGLLEQGGLSGNAAASFAATLIAAVEGATVLSRAEASLAPFDLVAAHMLDQIRRLPA
jgi:TetR/AcrR family transcriptional repressor of lmrAB and yxaGH operons